jgi:NAD(P)-dependent dehydrogenase (short-subunit alcohol dehydrogenase family)
MHIGLPVTELAELSADISKKTNVKSTLLFAKYFFATANPERASTLSVTSGSIVMPTKMFLGLSGYQTSKLAVVKMMEYLSLENPNIFCSSVHPGMVDTDIFRKSGATPDMLPMDTRKLL